MFTGLIQNLSAVKIIDKTSGGLRIGVQPQKPLTDLKLGESIALDGCCLTLIETMNSLLFFDVSPETLRVTHLSALRVEQIVNMERALLPTERLGGHFVLGHVDCLATIQNIEAQGGFWKITILYPREFCEWLIAKGSISVNGISLTINQLDDARSCFYLTIIPETWTRTNCQFWQIDTNVNLEFDIIGKYALRRTGSSLG